MIEAIMEKQMSSSQFVIMMIDHDYNDYKVYDHVWYDDDAYW